MVPFLLKLLLILFVTHCALSGCSTEPPSTASDIQTLNTDVTVNGGPWFADATPESDLKNVTHQATGATTYFFPAIMSPGAGLLDYDRDGNLDILLPSGCQLPFALNKLAVEKTSAANATPRLFRQISSWRFEEVTEAAGLNVAMYAMGCAIGDVNNDGFPDVYLTSYGGDHL